MSLPSFAKRVYFEFSEDRIPSVAAGITFFFLLALFPAVASVVSLYGLFADRHSIVQIVQMASGFLPEGGVRVLRTDLYRLVSQEPEKLGWAFGFGSLIAVWSASGGIKALLDGLNVAFEKKETRGFLHLTLNALAFTVMAVVLGAVAVFAAVTVSLLLKAWPDSEIWYPVLRIFVWPIGFCVCSVFVSFIYRFGPNRTGAPWRWITWGSAFTSAAWIMGTVTFSWYVANFGKYDRTYGDLGAIVGFLTWIWLSLVILLTGAEIVCETERLAAREPAEQAIKQSGLEHAGEKALRQDGQSL
jgi:membrane protein